MFRTKPKSTFYKSHPLSLLIKILVWAAIFITAFVLLFIIAYIFVKGIRHFSLDFFSLHYNSENVSVLPSIITTIYMIFISLLASLPFGIGCAIYLTEYAKETRFVKYIRVTTETLSGIPSIVYGLFGMLFFVTYLKWGFSILAGSFTLSIMILPLIIRSAEEAIIAVPDTFREASFGLGAGKLRAIFKIVLPSAMPGIFAGIILAIGRIVGESAALIYTAGTVAKIPVSGMDSARTLSVHMYALSSEGLNTDKAYATAVVLVALVILINLLATAITKKVGNKQYE